MLQALGAPCFVEPGSGERWTAAEGKQRLVELILMTYAGCDRGWAKEWGCWTQNSMSLGKSLEKDSTVHEPQVSTGRLRQREQQEAQGTDSVRAWN